mgnify:CR=1 FL=1
MRVAKAITNLTEAFERLPGIGPKSAQRLTYYLLHVPQAQLDKLGSGIVRLKSDTKQCQICQNISETDPCDICGDPDRDKSIICVVEQPLNVNAMERGGQYLGVYHVLHGVIDPLHNIGPDEIYIKKLVERITGETREIILALNPNLEGEATSLYLKRQFQILNFKFQISRLAYGLPVGADLEYADEMTLNHAMEGRRDF